tara:strand:- start:37 stop:624 length:588 start_codon:yes stop_codon:yes gene_type:complete
MILKRENVIIELKDQTVKQYGEIEFQEITFAQKINVRGSVKNKNFMTLQGKLLDAVLPIKPNTYTKNRKIKILWLGPNEWLVVDEDENNNDLFLKLEKNNSYEESAITDVSENRTIIRIRGKKVFKLLAKFIVLDLDKNLSNDSSVAQTLFIKVPIILVRNNINNQIVEIDLYANRSHTNYIYNLLIDGTKNLDF